jgi:uncharacterized protein
MVFMGVFLFSIFFLSIVGSAAYYVSRRLVGFFHLNQWKKQLIRLGIAFIIVSIPMTITLQRFGFENSVVDGFSWIGYIGLGFLSFIFTFMVIRDISFLMIRGYSRFKNRRIAQSKVRDRENGVLPDPSKRGFLIHSVNTGVVTVSGVLTGYGYANATQIPEVKTVEIPVTGLPEDLDGFRIVQLTDIHASPTIKRPFIEAVVEQANLLQPDMVALTGDLVDGSVTRLRYDVAPLAGLKAANGCFFVTGNHEYYSGVDSWVHHVRSLGFQVLLNQHHLISRKGARILVAGVTDYRGGRFDEKHHSDPLKAMKNAPDSDYKILLAHQPKSIFQASNAGFDLQISGHTHGGQFFPWNLFVGMTQPYVVGLDQYKGTHIYVSRGTGYWGPPLRLGSPSEITLIKLVKKRSM